MLNNAGAEERGAETGSGADLLDVQGAGRQGAQQLSFVA
jgi:hypothetical protein